jgi:integrase
MAIVAECPRCKRKQSVQRKRCTCGADLDKEKRGKKVKYHVIYRVNGKQVWKSLASFEGMNPYSLQDAKDVEARFMVAKRENKLEIFQPKKESTMTFKDLSEWYLNLEKVKGLASYETIGIYLNKFNNDLGEKVIADIKPIDLENLQAKRKAEGMADKTVDDEIGYARTMIIKAFDNDLVSGNTLKAFKKTGKLLKKGANARKRTLTGKEFERLSANSLPHLRNLLTVGYWTGMRKGEIINLLWDRIDMKKWMIHLEAEDTKDDEPRDVPMSSAVYEVLKAIPRPIHVEHVFLYNSKPIGRHFTTALKTTCKDAGITWGRGVKGGFIFHDLRHTFVTDMRKAGVPTNVRTSITGHSVQGMDSRYDTVDAEDKHQAISALEGYRGNVRLSEKTGDVR